MQKDDAAVGTWIVNKLQLHNFLTLEDIFVEELIVPVNTDIPPPGYWALKLEFVHINRPHYHSIGILFFSHNSPRGTLNGLMRASASSSDISFPSP